MTARDMQTEQAYHTGRVNALSQHVLGTGIVSGLGVEEVVDVGDGIDITLEPGVAIDGSGRSIIVDSTVTVSLSAPTTDTIHLYLAHDEVAKDRVPVPGAERTTEADSTHNRTVETFDLYFEDDPPDRPKGVPPVAFPSGRELDAADSIGLTALARAYHRHGDADFTGDVDVFLGTFTRDSGAWVETEEQSRRPYVYTNDMLYSALARHIADSGNPHGVSVEGVSEEIKERVKDLEVAEDLADRFDDLETRLDQVESERDALERYVIRESLEATVDAFQHVSDEFRSGTASDIVQRTNNAIRGSRVTERNAYLEFIENVLRRVSALVHELDGRTTEDGLSRYREAVYDLKGTLRDRSNGGVIAVARAHRDVCSAAASLSRR